MRKLIRWTLIGMLTLTLLFVTYMVTTAQVSVGEEPVTVSLEDVQEYMHKLDEVFLPTFHVVKLNSPVNIIQVVDGKPVLETIEYWIVEALTPYEDDINKLEALGDSSYMDLQGGVYTSYLMIDSSAYIPPSPEGLRQFIKEKNNIADTTNISVYFNF